MTKELIKTRPGGNSFCLSILVHEDKNFLNFFGLGPSDKVNSVNYFPLFPIFLERIVEDFEATQDLLKTLTEECRGTILFQ